MNRCDFTFRGARLAALPSGALWWESERLLCVSDLHLGKSVRAARSGGAVLPPYETTDTLSRLDSDLAETTPETVICLGDSFDHRDDASEVSEDVRLWLMRMQAGRRWIWIEGNHDAGGAAPGGSHRREHTTGAVVFRHIAAAGAVGEVTGHYHPKAVLTGRGGRASRPCFLYDEARLILPAYGTYTGGLRWSDPALRGLLGREARAILTGRRCIEVPAPACAA